MAYIEQLFEQYGYFVLIVGFLLEYIALPFPGQTTLIYAGFLSYKGVLHFLPSVALAFLGTSSGLTVTYFIGNKVGMPFVHRYGRWMFLSRRKMERTRRWFDKYGVILLLIGCFIPGVRHFIGYFSGIVGLPFRKFAVYIYTGAFVWVVCFVSLGIIFGPQWQYVIEVIEDNMWIILILLGGIGFIYSAFRWRIHHKKRQATAKRTPTIGRMKAGKE